MKGRLLVSLLYFLALSLVTMEYIKSSLPQGLSAFCAKWNISGDELGTEELGHMEMIAALVYQLTQNLCMEDIKKDGFDAYFVDHTVGIYPVSAAGLPFNAMALASKGDIITDLHEDLAADGARV